MITVRYKFFGSSKPLATREIKERSQLPKLHAKVVIFGQYYFVTDMGEGGVNQIDVIIASIHDKQR